MAACHLNLLTRKMTHQGQPLSATRHGMKRANQGARTASFERTVDAFVEAAVHAKVDTCNGVTECIVMNRLPRMGTGFVGMIEEKQRKRTQSDAPGAAKVYRKEARRVRPIRPEMGFQQVPGTDLSRRRNARAAETVHTSSRACGMGGGGFRGRRL